MRKSKIIIYCLSVVLLLAVVAYLNGYRLSVADATQVYNEKTHFSPAVMVYEKEVNDQAIVVVQNESWFKCFRITRSFGFLWKADPVQSSPVNKNTLDPSIKDEQLISGLIARSVWPEKMESMKDISIYGQDPVLLTPAQWWTITGLLQPVKWKQIDATVPIGDRAEFMTMTDASGRTITIYNDLTVYGTGYYMIVVDDHREENPNRQYYVQVNLLNKVEGTVNQSIAIAKLTEAITGTTFVSGAGLTEYDRPWKVDFVSINAAQSDELKALLNIQSWTLNQNISVDKQDMTLVDVYGTTYSFSKVVDEVSIHIRRIVGDKFTSEWWSAPASILKPIQQMLKTLEVTTPPSTDFIGTKFVAAQLGYHDMMFSLSMFDQYEDPSFKFALTSAQNTQLKSLLKLERWKALNQSFPDEAYQVYLSTIVLFGDDNERIFISAHTSDKALAIVERQGQLLYYSLDPSLMTAARNYLISLFVPKGPTAKVKAMEFVDISFNNEIVLRHPSVTERSTLKSILKIDTWKQAVNIDRNKQNYIVSIITSNGEVLYLSDYEGQILIEIYTDFSEFLELARYGYLAPQSIKDPLLKFIETLK